MMAAICSLSAGLPHAVRSVSRSFVASSSSVLSVRAKSSILASTWERRTAARIRLMVTSVTAIRIGGPQLSLFEELSEVAHLVGVLLVRGRVRADLRVNNLDEPRASARDVVADLVLSLAHGGGDLAVRLALEQGELER